VPIPLDPDIASALAFATAQAGEPDVPVRGDALALRAMAELNADGEFGNLPGAPDVSRADHVVAADDGHQIPLRWYTRADRAAPAAVVYLHGGGMICGTLDSYEPLVRHYVQLTGVPFLAVEYRRAPEFPGEGPATDCFAGLRWMSGHAAELGTDTARIAVMGDSAGGGLAAAAAILAREDGLALARQILIFPMLDDRNTVPDPLLAPAATWTYDNNYTGWLALLGEQLGGPAVSPIAAPARLTDFAGLAPAYIEVGDLDIFRDESISYAQNLMRAGVSCELHVYPGAPHGHDWLDPDSAISKRAVAPRLRLISAL